MCEKCWRQNLDDLEKADNLVLWMSHSDYESGGQEFESLRARQISPKNQKLGASGGAPAKMAVAVPVTCPTLGPRRAHGGAE